MCWYDLINSPFTITLPFNQHENNLKSWHNIVKWSKNQWKITGVCFVTADTLNLNWVSVVEVLTFRPVQTSNFPTLYSLLIPIHYSLTFLHNKTQSESQQVNIHWNSQPYSIPIFMGWCWTEYDGGGGGRKLTINGGMSSHLFKTVLYNKTSICTLIFNHHKKQQSLETNLNTDFENEWGYCNY
jgi:hypothetical protein